MERLQVYDGLDKNEVIINVRTFELRLFKDYVGWLTWVSIAPISDKPSNNNEPFTLRFPNKDFVHFIDVNYDDIILSVDPPQFEGKFIYLSHSVIELASQIQLSDFYPRIKKEEVPNGLPTNL